jgi:PhnB protein
MTAKTKPDGYHSITQMLTIKGAARLIEFLKAAFGAQQIMVIDEADGTVMHAELKIGDSIVMIGEAMKEHPPMPTSLYLYVADADAVYRTAVGAGGESVAEPANQFWGDRVASIKDPSGNVWWIATHVEDVDQDELMKRVQAFKRTS